MVTSPITMPRSAPATLTRADVYDLRSRAIGYDQNDDTLLALAAKLAALLPREDR